MPAKKKNSNNPMIYYTLGLALLIVAGLIVASSDNTKNEEPYCISLSEGNCKDNTGEYSAYCNGDSKYTGYYCINLKCLSTVKACTESQICENGRCVENEIHDEFPQSPEIQIGYYACEEGKCSYINGEGEDECTANNDCKHKECFNGRCSVVNTPGTTTCNIDDDCECVCDYGICCDGCHYKPSTHICDSQMQRDFGCPWGNECGSNVGVRHNVRYCPGDKDTCTGEISEWGEWQVYAECHEKQTCIDGVAACKYSPNCI